LMNDIRRLYLSYKIKQKFQNKQRGKQLLVSK